MNMKRTLNALYLIGLLAPTLFLTKPMMADEWNKKTEFQFSAPVEIPGSVLPAGKYVFEIADSQSGRDIVQVYSEDSQGKEHLVANLVTTAIELPDIPDQSTVHFEDRHSGSPRAIESWFYQGEKTGWKFVYPTEPGT
jgi:hypothetical protein